MRCDHIRTVGFRAGIQESAYGYMNPEDEASQNRQGQRSQDKDPVGLNLFACFYHS